MRLDKGGRIERAKPLSFQFDGRAYEGFQGDTLASALLANGVRLVGRSFKYHRPRGVYAAGVEEPNALMTIMRKGADDPNTLATVQELYDGLYAVSQNRWPSLEFDIMSVNGLAAPFLSAGFYYKTFMGSSPDTRFWMFCEKFIRRAAGLGAARRTPDPDRYEKTHAHVDVLVVGSGPAGLAAAVGASRAGASVMLVEQEADFGGGLLSRFVGSDGSGWAADAWRRDAISELEGSSKSTLLRRATAFGWYDNNIMALVERVQDHVAKVSSDAPRHRMWVVRAKQVVLATGAMERPLVFADNDRPGVMLASAARTYLNRYAVKPGLRVVIATNNDTAYAAAHDLVKAGVQVAAVIDARSRISAGLTKMLVDSGTDILAETCLSRAIGGRHVTGVEAAPLLGGPVRGFDCDTVLVSGGWSPVVHLQSQRDVRPRFDEARQSFLAGEPTPGHFVAGSITGTDGLRASAREGFEAGVAAARACGKRSQADALPPLQADEPGLGSLAPLWEAPDPALGGRRQFVDFQNDVTSKDVRQANREGYVSVEHMKRYTTLGMATDQGKTGNVNGLAILADARGEAIPAVGATRFRPPYTPVSFGALAGSDVGGRLAPKRYTPLHDWHVGMGFEMIEAGMWYRAWYGPKDGEDINAAYIREAGAVRKSVGMVDVSPLGKIMIQGPDAAEFLDRVYVNKLKSLKASRLRYVLLLREDGFLDDDGTIARDGENEFFLTTTTAKAAHVMTVLEYLAETAWPDLKVHLTSVTDAWGGMAVAGPRSRDLIKKVFPDVDVSNEGLPHMGFKRPKLGGARCRLHRASFSGELAYEVFVPAGHAESVWRLLHDAGREFGLTVYGTEAMGALRIEKGHIAGPEIDGRTTLHDVGLDKMSKPGGRHLGKELMYREALIDPNRPRLVGLAPVDGVSKLRAGSLIFEAGSVRRGHGLGRVTSVSHSPELGHYVALGFVSGGLEAREGEVMTAAFPLYDETVEVKVVNPVFVDPQGERLRG